MSFFLSPNHSCNNSLSSLTNPIDRNTNTLGRSNQNHLNSHNSNFKMKTKSPGCNDLVTFVMGCWVNGVWSSNNTSRHINRTQHTSKLNSRCFEVNCPKLISHAFSPNLRMSWLQILIFKKSGYNRIKNCLFIDAILALDCERWIHGIYTMHPHFHRL